MKNYSLFWISAILFANSFALCAQSPDKMVEEGRRWSVAISSTSQPYLQQGTCITFLKGDTIVNGLTYKKVYETRRQDMGDQVFRGGIRQEGKKVYFLPENADKERLQFDFGLKAGETLETERGPLQVIKTEVREVEGIQRNVQFVNYVEGIHIAGWEDQWIEGIGSYLDGIYNDRCELVGVGYVLLCCHQGEDLLYQSEKYDDCYVENYPLISEDTKWTEVVYNTLSVPSQWREITYEVKEVDRAEEGYSWSVYTDNRRVAVLREDFHYNLYISDVEDLESGQFMAPEFLLYSFTKPWKKGDMIRYGRDLLLPQIIEHKIEKVDYLTLKNGRYCPVVDNILFRIGHLSGLIYSLFSTPKNGTTTGLLNFYRDGELLFENERLLNLKEEILSVSSVEAETGLGVRNEGYETVFTLAESIPAIGSFLSIYNVTGQKIGIYPFRETTLSVSGLPRGVYLYRLTAANGQTGNGKFTVME